MTLNKTELREIVASAKSIIEVCTIPAILWWRSTWLTAEDSEQKTKNIAIADYALEYYNAKN